MFSLLCTFTNAEKVPTKTEVKLTKNGAGLEVLRGDSPSALTSSCTTSITYLEKGDLLNLTGDFTSLLLTRKVLALYRIM